MIGILANIAGLALGIVLSLVLVFVINKQSFGWTIQFHWPVFVLSARSALFTSPPCSPASTRRASRSA